LRILHGYSAIDIARSPAEQAHAQSVEATAGAAAADAMAIRMREEAKAILRKPGWSNAQITALGKPTWQFMPEGFVP
jgi:hypothetical protein